jgi:hypothetical protein
MTDDEFNHIATLYGFAPSRPLREMLEAAVKAEREACARVCDDLADISGHYAIAATAIRKRGEE